MAQTHTFAEDLAVWADKKRVRFGDPPTAEELIALRDGELSEAAAERLHERLAVDSELADIYLELKRCSDFERSSENDQSSADSKVDDLWRTFAGKLGSESPVTEAIEVTEANVIPFRRWPSARVLQGLAAAWIAGLGLVWLLADRKDLLPVGGDGKYYQYVVLNDEIRTPKIEIPQGFIGLELQVNVSELRGPIEIRLLDAIDRLIMRKHITVESGQSRISFPVPSDALTGGRAYRLTAQSVGNTPTNSNAINKMFIPFFLPNSEASKLATSLPMSCNDLYEEIERAIKLRETGKPQEAKDIYLASLGSEAAGQCCFQEARIWNGLGAVAIHQLLLKEAVSHLGRANQTLDQCPPSGDPNVGLGELGELAAAIAHNRAAAYFRLGWFEEANDALRQTQTLDGRFDIKADEQARTLVQLARVNRLLGEHQKSREFINEGLDLIEDAYLKIRAVLWQEQAALDVEMRRFAQAEKALDRASQIFANIGEKLAEANVISDRASLAVEQGRWIEGLQWAEEALHLASAAGTPDLNLETHARYQQSVALAGVGDLEGARRASDRGLALLESLRDAWSDLGFEFFALRQKYYRHRLDLALASGNSEAAWTVFESYRSRGLLASVSQRAGRFPLDPDPAHTSQIVELRKSLLEAVWQLDQWDPATGDQGLELLEIRFRAHKTALVEFQTQTQLAGTTKPPTPGITLKSVEDLLEPKSLMLAFVEGNEQIYVLSVAPHKTITGQSLGIDRQVAARQVAELTRSLQPTATKTVGQQLDRSVHNLSRGLLDPVARLLTEYQRLVIVTDETLEQLPFEILRSPLTGQRLIETHEIVYVPSLSILAASRERARTCTKPEFDLLAMGDPIFGSRDPRWPGTIDDPRSADQSLALPRLPATAEEVLSIAEVYTNSIAALGIQATRWRFLIDAPKHQILHIATHAWSDSQVPERSRIFLSCLNSEEQSVKNCDLYFKDLARLNLCGQIVILSACETAGGRAMAGEGVLGLPRAFLHAGASTVVASLWPVTDKSTAALMAAFHRHLRAGGNPAAALRKAKLGLIDSDSPLSHWAAFVVLGDWQIGS